MSKIVEDLIEKRVEEKKLEVLLESIKSLMKNLTLTEEQAMAAMIKH